MSKLAALPVHKLDFSQTLEEAFPKVEPGLAPLGSRVLVQLRTPVIKSRGGIILTRDTSDTEMWNSQVAKVISMGPVAFCNRATLAPWPEGAWVKPGDFVRVPKYAGDRWTQQFGDKEEEKALFILFNDLDITGRVTSDPRTIKAFI